MSEKLDRLREVNQIAEHELQLDEFRDQKRKEAYFLLGGIRVVQKMSKSLLTQEMEALRAIEEQNIYADMGYDTFVDFLASPDSPISKNQYYDRKKIYEAEGPEIFDLLNKSRVSVKARKLLAAGDYQAISIEGDTLKIGDESADLSNSKLIRSLLESYSKEIERGRKEVKKAESAAKAAKDLADNLKAKFENPGEEVYENELAATIIQMGRLIKAAQPLSHLERSEKADHSIRSIGAQVQLLSEILYAPAPSGQGSPSVNDNELAELMG